jgi:hypothetical protein
VARRALTALAAVTAAVVVGACGEGFEDTPLSANPKKCEQQMTKGASPQWLADNWDIDPSQSIAIATEIFDFCREQRGEYEFVEDARDQVGLQLSDKGY